MKYRTPAAFRTALEDRLNRAAAEGGYASAMRLRKRVVFERLLARLQTIAPDRWIVKGGVALDLRLPDRARTTKDLDLVQLDGETAATLHLLAAQAADLGDHFSFAIEREADLDVGLAGAALGFRVRATLAGRLFEAITVDIGFGDGTVGVPDRLRGTRFLTFAELEPIEVLALPVAHHVAEKVHAYTRVYEGGHPSSRVKDLVDIVLMAVLLPFDAAPLGDALRSVFVARATHPLPMRLPVPPPAWTVPYRTLAEEVGIVPELAAGYRLAAAFLDPILSAEVTATAAWDAEIGTWAATP